MRQAGVHPFEPCLQRRIQLPERRHARRTGCRPRGPQLVHFRRPLLNVIMLRQRTRIEKAAGPLRLIGSAEQASVKEPGITDRARRTSSRLTAGSPSLRQYSTNALSSRSSATSGVSSIRRRTALLWAQREFLQRGARGHSRKLLQWDVPCSFPPRALYPLGLRSNNNDVRLLRKLHCGVQQTNDAVLDDPDDGHGTARRAKVGLKRTCDVAGRWVRNW